MRAVRYEEFGLADVLRVVDLPVPRIKPDEVLVKVRAAGVAGRASFGTCKAAADLLCWCR